MIEIYETIVIGAGISGATAARMLGEYGGKVLVLEKARGSGGRLASKRIRTEAGDELAFDLGCESFGAQTGTFRSALQEWESVGLVHRLQREGNGQPLWVGASRNSALTRAMLGDLPVAFGVRVTEITYQDGVWQLQAIRGDNEIRQYAARSLILSAPAQQTRDLLPNGHPFIEKLAPAVIRPQWVVVLAVPRRADFSRGLQELGRIKSLRAMPEQDAIDVISFESEKPSRPANNDFDIYQIQLTSQWTENRIDWPREQVLNALIDELEAQTGCASKFEAAHVHRWLYAFSGGAASEHSYLLDDSGLGVCGDYFCASGKHDGVESAYLSGRRLAEACIARAGAGAELGA